MKWERMDVEKFCFIKHGVYSGYTYRATSIKVLDDHKVHSAVVLPFLV